jgi:hypothetical protein
MSTRRKVLFIGLGILTLGIVILTLGVLLSPVLRQTFQCGYDLSLNNSSLTREQISEYCNNQIPETDINLESGSGLITVGFGIVFIVIGLIITGINGGIWLIQRRRTTTIIRRERREAPSAGVSIEMKNNGEIEEDDWFTPKKVIAYCLIVGLISGTLSIFINSLVVLSAAAFVFASITVWYIFGDKFHRWEERRRTKEKYFP